MPVAHLFGNTQVELHPKSSLMVTWSFPDTHVHTEAHCSTHNPCLIDRDEASTKLTSKAVDRTAPPQGSKEDDKRRQGGEVEKVKFS